MSPARDLILLAAPLDAAQYVTIHGDDEYTTNLPLDALLDDDVLIAHSVFAAPLSIDHGWPAHGGAEALCVERCQMDFSDRISRQGSARILGSAGLS